MQESQTNLLDLAGQLVQTFGTVKVAETQAELNALQYGDYSLGPRPEETIDESAASTRGLFDFSDPVKRANTVGAGIVIVGLIASAFLLRRLLR